MVHARADVDDGPSVVAVGVGVAITVAMAGLAGLVFLAGSDSGEQAVTGPWGAIAFTVVIAGPAVVAVAGFDRRPWVLGAAGVALFPRMLLSFSPLFFPLAIPGVIFIVQAVGGSSREPRSPWQATAAVISLGLLIAAPLCLLVHQDPTSWSTPSGSGYASDVITATESMLACLCVAAAVVAAWLAPPDSG